MLTTLQSLRLNLLHVGHAQLDHNWDYDNVISPFTRLFYVTKGSAKMYHSDQAFELRPGHLYLIPSYVYNRYKCEVFHEQYYVSFFDEIGSGLSIYNLRDFNYEVKAHENDEYLFQRLVAIYPHRQVINSDPKAYVHQPAALLRFNEQNAQSHSDRFIETQGILSVLLSRFMKNTNTKPMYMEGKDDFYKVLLFISQNLHEPLTVRELASKVHLSVDHFSRVFQQRTGLRPNKYIQSKRIQRAQLLLLTTNDPLAQIAIKVGLENFSYFSRTFKKFTGKSPGRFRKERLNV